MRKNILILAVIFLLINFLFILFALYKDIKVNKFFNYYREPSDLTVNEEIPVVENASKSIIFSFRSDDNFLGGANINVERLGEYSGTLKFSLTDKVSGVVLSENTIPYSYFQTNESFPFGFPEIKESRNKSYLVKLDFYNDDAYNFPNRYVDLISEPVLKVKHVFPRDFIKENPITLFSLLIKRFADAAGSVKVTETLVPTAILSLFIVGLTDKSFYKNKGWLKHIEFLGKINPFVIVGILVISLPFLYITGNYQATYRYASYLFIAFFLSTLWLLMKEAFIHNRKTLARFFESIISFVEDKNFNKIRWLFIFSLIILSGFSGNYFLGGDDTKIFYIYPGEFFTNFASRNDPSLALSSVDAVIPSQVVYFFTLFLTVVKTFIGGLNMQAMLYTANIIWGIYFFYKFLFLLSQSKSGRINFIFLLASLMYVFSIFNFYVLFNAKLISIYLITIYPVSLYLFLKYQLTGKSFFIILISLLLSVFAQINVAAPWFLGTILATFPILVYLLFKNIKRGIFGVAIFAITVLLLNLHWIVFIPYSSTLKSTPVTSETTIVSSDFRKENSEGISHVSQMNNLFFPLLNTYHKKIQDNFQWPFISLYYQWYLKFLPLNLIFILIILLSLLKIKKLDIRKPYFYILLSFLFSLYLVTVNITKWGTDIFIFLNNNIPGFVLFRNMYDKFSYALAFVFALAVGFGGNYLIQKLKDKGIQKILFCLLALAIFVQAKPFVFREFDKLPIWTTTNSYWDTQSINVDYLNLVKFVNADKNDGKYLSLPLTTGNAAIIEDESRGNHFYNGVSPLLPLTGRNDFAGLLSFGSSKNLVESYIRNRDYQSLGNLLSKLNVKYVVLNKNIPPDLADSFVFSNGLYSLQNEEFYRALLGEKIADFGNKYSVYKISDEYKNEKVFTTDDINSFPDDFSGVYFQKISDGRYEISLENKKGNNLVFLEPNNPGWKLYDDKGVELTKLIDFPFDYANAWDISSLEGSKKMVLYFEPEYYFRTALFISLLSYIGFLAYVALFIFRKNENVSNF